MKGKLISTTVNQFCDAAVAYSTVQRYVTVSSK
jgi:hypothetical protein